MEAAVAFGRGSCVKKEDKRVESADGVDEDSACKEDVRIKTGNHGKEDQENEDKTSSSDQTKDISCSKLQDGQLESARVEMGEVREENQRLKMSLHRIMKDYEALRMQFLGMVGQDEKKLPIQEKANGHEKMEEPEFVSLTLGRFPSDKKKDDKGNESIEHLAVKQGLSLGLDCKFEEQATAIAKVASSPNQSLTNSVDQEAKEEAGETWPPSKSMKIMRSRDDEVTQHNPPKKARVCVRARCETATMNDGCQWRKYGQKIAKGNPCPRAYYRCTGSPTCPVRKQVQRCADDMSILITTYEGNHNHPLPVSATAMASTTSAAASMLLSGSSSSNSAAPTAQNSSPSTNLQGLNFYLSGNSNSKHFYLPNSSISTTSPTHPTITLDLTSNASSSSSSHFSKFSSSFPNPRYPFSSQLDFGSSRNNVLSWNFGLLNYSNQAYNRNNPNNNIYQNYLQKNNVSSIAAASTQQALPDTIAAATKAITADPSFQTALAAALTSIIGNGGAAPGGAVGGHGGIGEKLKSRSGEQPFQSSTYGHQTTKGNVCGTSFLNNIAATSTHSSQPAANMVFVPSTSLPFSTSKSASASPADHIDLTN